ncbi:conserved unknown protein [Ectocarpus siliculosus]|uniref:Uncharacterized protein n=1 Tax=Ectocarpus siliculosus TaxID=2880 RepID=D7FPJ5_ECTSI|nr:conserved unknown protein [Ectocarpus siliculosus]|eukprot:CBJ30452.1 conserved unknown protein [Ectocarpus siliculosus]
MADFYGVWSCRASVLRKLDAMLDARNAARQQELQAATDIKRVYRGKTVRNDLNRKRAAMIRIASAYRGYRGRVRTQQILEEMLARERMAVYHYHALEIQGAFRGYQSRKYNYNHARRKRYLQEVVDAGDAVRAELREHEQALLEERAANKEVADQAKLQATAQNLHHLVSTKSISGVFNSPYMRNSGRMPTIRGVEVEQHLTISAKDLLRTRGYTKRGLEVDLNGQQRIPLKGLESRRSVQAQDPYDLPKKAADLEDALSRLKRVGPREFHAGNRVALAPYQRGISGGTQFLDPWRNPFLVRGVPRDQAEMQRPLNETTLGKFPEKPFHVSVGGNKSTVLPNGIFDVILEAEQTGGVVRTQNGRTRRFGIPDTCDVNDDVVPGSTLFFPPSPPKQRPNHPLAGTA